MTAVERHAPAMGTAPACEALGVCRSLVYRRRARPRLQSRPRPRPRSVRALGPAERGLVLQVLHSERFVDRAPAEVAATLLDEGTYLCSERTMYRILEANAEARERRRQLRHPQYKRPELLATGPNQVWSWDITKLKGPVKWSLFYLYVMLDIFSRYVVGWLLGRSENSRLSRRLIEESCRKEGIGPGQLEMHSDGGAPMRAKCVSQLLVDLGVDESHSRPHVSNDNPFSEAQFKTLKYCPEFPERFGSLEDARAFCRSFFPWYNTQHRHGGLCLLTPETVHRGRAGATLEARRRVLQAAYLAHPERFVRGLPAPRPLPEAVWINPPEPPVIAAPGVAEIPTAHAGSVLGHPVPSFSAPGVPVRLGIPSEAITGSLPHPTLHLRPAESQEVLH